MRLLSRLLFGLFRCSNDHLSRTVLVDLIASGPSNSCVQTHLLKLCKLVAQSLHFLFNLRLVKFEEIAEVWVFGGLWGGRLLFLIIGGA